MSVQVYPLQKRYNDPTQQLRDDPGTIYKRKYLSRVSNQRLQAIGNNIVLIGLKAINVEFLGSIITVNLSPGKIIHDSTLIAVTSATTLTLDVSAYSDTPSSGSHLGVFTDFLFTETPDADAQTPLTIHMFHVNVDGTVIEPAVSWDVDRCKILLAAVNFTKSSGDVIAADLDITSLVIDTAILTVGGMDLDHINFYDVLHLNAEESYLSYLADDYKFDNIFKKEFIFQDLSKK